MRDRLPLERLDERVAAALLVVLAPLAREERADLRPCTIGLRDVHPVAARALVQLVGRQHLDRVTALQRVGERHDATVDLRTDAAVADVGVHRVGEVERRRTRRERLDLALGREDVDLVVVEVELQALHELLRARGLRLPLHEVANPVLRLPVRGGLLLAAGLAARLVHRVRRDTELRRAVHVDRAHLDLERLAARPDHRLLQRKVSVHILDWVLFH